MEFPKKQYDIIYADPPWFESGGGVIKRGADNHYPLMKTKDICNLPVKDISNTNAHLYMWVTNNFLKDGFDVVEAWGFRYITLITWVKDRFGLGQYFRGQTEHCMFCVKGNIPYKLEDGKRQQGVTYLQCERKEHSSKPQEMRSMIEKVSDREGFSKLELFARNKSVGWDVWGNDDSLIEQLPTVDAKKFF